MKHLNQFHETIADTLLCNKDIKIEFNLLFLKTKTKNE